MAEEPHIERLRRLIEQQYAHVTLGSGSVGGCFGSILCHELHHGGEGSGLHFARLAQKWGLSLSMLGELIADHCRRLEDDPIVQHPEATEVPDIVVINMQTNEAQCRFCGQWWTNRCGGAIPISMETGLVVANDFTGETGGVTACPNCRKRHAAGEFVGGDVPY